MIENTTKITALIMAAGASQRFGGKKQLANINGQFLINAVLDPWQNSPVDNIVVALGAFYEDIVSVLPQSISVVHCENWSLGLGANIAQAVESIKAETIIVGLGDQVAVSAEHIEQLIQFSLTYPDKIICSLYNGTPGVPALFPFRFQNKLKQLSGDKGAKSLLLSHTQDLVCVPYEPASVDIDTKMDLSRWLERDKS